MDVRRPTIAVCIPSKNRPQDILSSLESIGQQDVQPQQIIIVDQSPSPYQLPNIPNLLHVHDTSVTGSSGARNRGWALATTDVIFFLDDDVELRPNCLSALVDAAVAHPDAVAFQCVIQDFTARVTMDTIFAAIFHRGFFNGAQLKTNPVQLRRLAGGATAFRTSLINQERFDECLVGYSYGEDWEFSYRARRYGRLLLIPEARMIHHASPVNRFERTQRMKDRWVNFLYFYDKLNAKEYLPNRFWRWWWMLGESLHWLRQGMGFPLLGIETRRVPARSLSLRRSRMGDDAAAPG